MWEPFYFYQTMIKINISVGELFDRLSILHIKRIMIEDAVKMIAVRNEIKSLESIASFYLDNPEFGKDVQEQFDLLIMVNKNLWNVEDDLRAFEEKQLFDEEFVLKARSVYKLNDRRYIIKTRINEITGSENIEVKQHL